MRPVLFSFVRDGQKGLETKPSPQVSIVCHATTVCGIHKNFITGVSAEVFAGFVRTASWSLPFHTSWQPSLCEGPVFCSKSEQEDGSVSKEAGNKAAQRTTTQHAGRCCLNYSLQGSQKTGGRCTFSTSSKHKVQLSVALRLLSSLQPMECRHSFFENIHYVYKHLSMLVGRKG